MPVGTGAIQSTNLPSEAFTIDPDAFAQMTVRNEATVETAPASAADIDGMSWQKQLPQTGIISRLVVTFAGTMTVANGQTATTSARWPYGLVDRLYLAANGQNNLFSVDGLDLHALRFARNPAYSDVVDTFPGTVGGGDTLNDTVDGTPVYLTWEIPVAMDDTSLVGALYAQSGATSLVLDRTISTSKLFTAGLANVTLEGEFTTSLTRFSVPRSNAEGRPLVIPDLSRLHAVTATELPLVATGDVWLELQRTQGALARLFLSGNSAANTPLRFDPAAAAANSVTQLRLEYGNAQRPYQYQPASVLLSRNNDYYGGVLPYRRVALDFVRENAPRDMVLLQGVTDLNLVPTINSAVVLNGGSARMVSETLF